ncbi:hypothetical protein L0222_26085 [bacterium]|nr:hypothetical protein [bacterium]
MEAETIDTILKTQEEEIQKEAFLSFEEKIRILINLQRMVAEIRPDLNYGVWSLTDLEDPQGAEQ